MLRPYREVLSHPGAPAFSGAGAIARLPMAMVGIGIVLMVSDLYGSYGLAGRVSAAYVVSHAVCAPQLSRLVDTRGQARVMRPAIACTLVGLGGLVAVAAVQGSPWLLYASAVVAGASTGSVGSLVRARWSQLVTDPRQVHTAYSLESAVDELEFVVGPVLATVLATGVTPVSALVVPMLAVGVGGLWLFSQRATEPPTTRPDPTVRRRSVLAAPGMALLVVVFVFMGAVLGGMDVSTIAFAEERGNTTAAGVVLALFATGSLIAGLGYGARQWLSALWLRFAVGMAALGAGVSLFFVVSTLPALAAVMFVAGFAMAPTLINGNGLVQHLVPRAQLTEGLTWVGTALGLGVSLGASIGGAVIDRDGSHGGFLVVVLSAAAAVVAMLASLPALRRRTAGPLTEPVRVEEIPELLVEYERMPVMTAEESTGAPRHDGATTQDEGAQPGPEHLIVMGVSGSGKTTVGRALAERLGRPFAEGDDFHPEENIAAMSTGVPLTDTHRRPWLLALREWLTAEAEAGRSTVMACSALRVEYRDVLREAEGRVRFVHLSGDPELIETRQAAREGHFMPASLMESQHADLEPLRPSEDGVMVLVTGDPDTVADDALEALGK